MNFILLAVLGCLVGALACLLVGRWPRVTETLGAGVAMASCGCGLWGAFRSLLEARVETRVMNWALPNAALCLGLDPLSSFFLVPLFALGVMAACYGRVYLREHAPRRPLHVSWAAFNVLIAGMALVLLSRHALPFLFSWEVMSLAAFVLVSFDHEDAAVRRASFVYLIATHIGVTCLTLFFVMIGAHAQSLEFSAMVAAERPSLGLLAVLFPLSLIGFGAKAGIVPWHVWLPEAHAAAPSHVSAMMSGVLIKMGVYGVMRSVLLLGGPIAYFGQLLMGLGIVGAMLGVGCALYQRDVKRLLAYSSVENVGLILLGLGTGLWGMTSGRPVLGTVGLVAALLHVWNHGAMKGLMFLAVGSLAHRCHTKDIEQLGGLLRRMPQTATFVLMGATGMAGLPPLNGFVSEWLLYSGLLNSMLIVEGGSSVVVMVAVAALSLVGAMAALCFSRLVGIALLGEPRSPRAREAKEVPWSMLLPMGVLAAVCVGLALFPMTAVRLLFPVVSQFFGTASLLGLMAATGVEQIGLAHRVIALVLVVALLAMAFLLRARGRGRDDTWGCGYLAPTARMQYTGRAFSELFTSSILPRALGPKFATSPPSGLFPSPGHLESDSTDPVTRGGYEPLFERWASRFSRLRWMQQGILHVYVLYILVTLVVALGFSTFMSMGGPR